MPNTDRDTSTDPGLDPGIAGAGNEAIANQAAAASAAADVANEAAAAATGGMDPDPFFDADDAPRGRSSGRGDDSQIDVLGDVDDDTELMGNQASHTGDAIDGGLDSPMSGIAAEFGEPLDADAGISGSSAGSPAGASAGADPFDGFDDPSASVLDSNDDDPFAAMSSLFGDDDDDALSDTSGAFGDDDGGLDG